MIKLYSQSGCVLCSTVKKLLSKKNINYELIEITYEEVEKYRELGITHTPILQLEDGTTLSGKAIIDWVSKQ